MAKIEARTDVIPKIAEDLEKLRASTVPMSEHVKVMADVETLKERDLGARSDWEDVKGRVLGEKGMLATLWDERAQLRGSMRTLKVLLGAQGVVVVALGLWVALHNAGVSVSVH